ncbi:MAG: tetratricopeptide repeat protein, partial [Pseudomonadota bacterium]
TLDSAVSRLRARLGDLPKDPQYIQTVPKVGYRLLAPVVDLTTTTPSQDRSSTDALSSAVSPEPTFIAGGWFGRAVVLSLLIGMVLIAVFLLVDEGDALRVPMAQTDGPRPTSPSLAVVAFSVSDPTLAERIVASPEHQGLAMDLQDQLARLPGLRVASRNSSQRFASDELEEAFDRQRVGQLLGVDYLLRGLWERDSGELSLRLELLETDTGTVRWTQRHDRSQRSSLDVLDAVLAQVSSSLLPQNPGVVAQSGIDRPTSGPTYDLYLLGRHYWHQRQADSLLEAERLFREAVSLEPSFALAHIGLASTFLSMMRYSGLPAERALELARAPMARAMELAPSLAETHELLGQWHWLKAEWVPAEASLRRALTLNPNLVMAQMYLGNVYNDSGRLDQAYISYQRAETLDPLHTTVLMNLTQVSLKLGLFDRADRYLQRAQSLFPSHDFLFGLSVHLALSAGDDERARTLLAQWQDERVKLRQPPDPVDVLACMMAASFLGEISKAQHCQASMPEALNVKGMRTLYTLMAMSYGAWIERQFSESMSEQSLLRLGQVIESVNQPGLEDPVLLYELAVALAQAERTEEAVRVFLRASELGGRDLGWMRHDPRLAPIRSRPAVVRKLDELGERQAIMVSALENAP